jgi:hypothetical protein
MVTLAPVHTLPKTKRRAMINKLLVVSLLCVSAIWAAPVFTPESQPIDMNDPHLGQKVLIIPNSQWLVYFEDLYFTVSDRDFNDYAMYVRFDSVGDLGFIWKIGGVAAHFHIPFWQKVGNELVIGLWDVTSGEKWYTGPANRNRDGTPHAWVIGWGGNGGSPPVDPVPEPASMGLMGLGLAAIVTIKKKLIN